MLAAKCGCAQLPDCFAAGRKQCKMPGAGAEVLEGSVQLSLTAAILSASLADVPQRQPTRHVCERVAACLHKLHELLARLGPAGAIEWEGPLSGIAVAQTLRTAGKTARRGWACRLQSRGLQMFKKHAAMQRAADGTLTLVAGARPRPLASACPPGRRQPPPPPPQACVGWSACSSGRRGSGWSRSWGGARLQAGAGSGGWCVCVCALVWSGCVGEGGHRINANVLPASPLTDGH